MEWHELRAHRVEWIRQTLAERGVAPSTVNVALSALSGVLLRLICGMRAPTCDWPRKASHLPG